MPDTSTVTDSPSPLASLACTAGLACTVRLTVVARYLSRAVPIKGSFQGTVEQGYLAGSENDFKFSPETVVVSGRAEFVNQVAYAPGESQRCAHPCP